MMETVTLLHLLEHTPVAIPQETFLQAQGAYFLNLDPTVPPHQKDGMLHTLAMETMQKTKTSL